MAGAEKIERLRHYLRELSPQARALLVAGLERSLLRGDEAAGADLVLQELRRIVREQHEGVPRIGNSARLFFKPIEPFLVDDRGDHQHPGRIARASLDTLWTWIRRDLLPYDARILADEVSDALAAGDDRKAEQLTRAFQDRVVAAIEASFEAAAAADKFRQHLLGLIGTQRPREDAATLKCVLKGRDGLAKLAAQLPIQIANLADAQLDKCKALIEATSAHDGDLFLYALLIMMSRLAAPWQLIRLGIKAADSGVAARVAETHYSVAVTIVLADLERMVGELRHDLRNGRGVAVGVLLKTIHDAARGLRTELAMPVDSTWGRALGAVRAQIADLLKSEIESIPGRMRQLLRPRPSAEIRPYSVLDAGEVDDTAALVEFVGDCRHFAGELAIDEMTQRAYSELQQYLDGGTRALLDGLRHAGEGDRRFRQSQVDAAARFCAKVFGDDYASLVGKAAEVAGAPERRAMRAGKAGPFALFDGATLVEAGTG
jgi:hypothetical protein